MSQPRRNVTPSDTPIRSPAPVASRGTQFLASCQAVRRLVVAVVAVFVVTVALALRFFMFPPTGSAEPTDAVVVLAGAPEIRLPLAEQLAREGAGVVVLSAPDGEVNEPARELCQSRKGDLTIFCLWPDPPDTRGEAQAIGQLVAERNWDRITVVTSSYHVVRAGLLIDRCTDADVEMVEARPLISLGRWVGRILHEIGGVASAMVDRSC
jgi:uncharacterized SAM-binding protein YcdF (DUF218 family)